MHPRDVLMKLTQENLRLVKINFTIEDIFILRENFLHMIE